MQLWMIVQIVISVALILVVILQPRKSGVGGGVFGGRTRADRSSKFKNLSLLNKLTIGLATAFMVISLFFSFILI